MVSVQAIVIPFSLATEQNHRSLKSLNSFRVGLSDSQLIYAAPSFLSFAVRTWHELGRVSMKRSDELDVGMALTQTAHQNGVPVELLLPSFVCIPRWPLANWGAIGYGTFYGGQVFHLFQSRHNKAYEFAFYEVARHVLQDKDIDYIYIFDKMNSSRVSIENYIRSMPRNSRGYLRNCKNFFLGRI